MQRVILVVAGLVLVAAAPFSFVVSRAQQPTTVSPALMQLAQAQGTVRVIVELDLATEPEGTLAEPARTAQRQTISIAQGQVLARMTAPSVRVNHQFTVIPFMALEVTPEALAILAQTPGVRAVTEDVALPPHLAQSVPLVQGDDAWDAGYDGTGWVVAVLDTGVDKAHTFLNGKVVSEACYSGNASCPNGLTSQVGDGAGVPCTYAPSSCRHGTHVAGIAAGRGDTFSGVAKGAGVISIQVFSQFGPDNCSGAAACPLSYASDQIAGLQRVYALRNTYNIASANMSLGGGRYYNQASCDAAHTGTKAAIDTLRSVGIATVISSGNNGFVDSMGGPGCISTAISVGSTTKSDQVSSFSNAASFLSLLAPGESINSSVTGGGFAFFNGTSMAAPHVAGAWAVVKQAVPSGSVTDLLAAFRASNTMILDAGNGLSFPRLEVMTALLEAAPPAPGAFGRTAPTNGATGQSKFPILTWAASANATSYEYCIDTSHNGVCNTSWIAVGNATSANVSGLVAATSYSWHVRANNLAGTTYANGDAGTFWSFTTASVLGTISLSVNQLNFAGVNTGGVLSPLTDAQTVVVSTSNPGIGWTVTANQPWVQINGASGVAGGVFSVSIINPGNVLNGVTNTSATVTVRAPGASNEPRLLTVNLSLKTPGALQAPIGFFDTPVNGATVQGSMAVTGWALDDVGIDRVEIWRDLIPGDNAPPFYSPGHPAHGKVFIANGTFVAGTRPDVDAAYPTAPFRHRAGWGYLLLTWGFPNANGSFVLTALAWDKEQKHTVLGTKSITVNNATATKPFGSIDVPSYGGTFSGHQFTFGWALTPSAGCTMVGGQHYMTIDSAPPYFVVNYGSNRTDIAAAFPGFVDANNAGGAVALNSTLYPDGIYTIGWLVYDNCGNGDGIGSRFFRILNGGGIPAGAGAASELVEVVDAVGPSFSRVGQPLDLAIAAESDATLWLARGMGRQASPLDRSATVWLSQTGRVELHAADPAAPAVAGVSYEAYLAVNGALAPLPLGSSFDATRGVFSWQPVAGFLGEFPIRILRLSNGQVDAQWTTPVVVSPGAEDVLLQIDTTASVIAGWAADPAATRGSGISAVHVWARRMPTTGQPGGTHFFLGQANLGGSRTDVAAAYGPQFSSSGYSLAVPPLAPGTYEVIVYALSERTGRWEAARVTTMKVGSVGGR